MENIVGFNKEWVRKISKTKFKQLFEKVYPNLDLSAEYDKIKKK